MFRIFVTVALACTTYALTAQTLVPIDSVSAYIGKQVKVCDKVVGSYVTKGDKPVTYLNLGADYPNTKLTLVIFQSDLQHFDSAPSDHYKNMNVCVTGEIKLYKERPQIVILSPTQIQMAQ